MSLASQSAWRRILPPVVLAGVVGALAVWADGGTEPRAWLLAMAAMFLAAWAARRGDRRARTLGVAASVVVASLGPDTATVLVDALGAAGALVCAVVAARALSEIPADGGVVRPLRLRAWPWAALLVVGWWGAIGARLAPQWGGVPGPADVEVQGGRGWAVFGASVTPLVLWAQAEWTLRRRRLELGVTERATAIRALLVTGMVVAGIVALVGRARGDALGRLVVTAASIAVALAASAGDAVRVARVARRVVALAIVGGSVVLLGASASEGRGWDAWSVSAVVGVVLLVIGASAARIEGPLRPAGGAWLDAFARATVEAGRGDPDDALRAALLALRAPAGPQSPAPELWTFSPTRVTSVDAAGYAHEREGELPGAMLVVAGAEPEATVRTEVLDALEVRRPDLRPLARWMTDRGMMLATLVTCDGETEGLLVLPRGARSEPFTLEEARALKDTADRLAAACRARGTQARMLTRAHDAMLRADAAEDRVERMEHARTLDVGRDALATTRLARPATIGVYAAASRLALEALERRTAVDAPIAVVAPSGVDPVPYLARAHRTGARKDAPLVLVDATSAREQDLARWTDPAASPLALADRGLLVLLDGAALPMDVQLLVARALAENRVPWERPDRIDVQLAFTGVASPGALVEQGRLDASLAARLGDAGAEPVELPRLRDRAEDLRAILTDRLAREGLRVLGRPVGIEQAAYARLVEHDFPGEDAELTALVQRLVAGLSGDVVRAADVEALGLLPAAPQPRAHKGPRSA